MADKDTDKITLFAQSKEQLEAFAACMMLLQTWSLKYVETNGRVEECFTGPLVLDYAMEGDVFKHVLKVNLSPYALDAIVRTGALEIQYDEISLHEDESRNDE